MKVILLNNIKKVGSRFDVVDVAPGFAQNFLIPQKKALPATESNLANIDQIKTDQAGVVAQERKDVEAAISALADVVLTHAVPTNEQGGLYESITTATISDLLKEQASLELDEVYINLEQPIKHTGEYEIVCSYEDISGTCKLTVSAEEVEEK